MGNQFRKLPPFGKAQIERQKFGNNPDELFVFLGRDSWDEAKRLQQRTDIGAIVLPSGADPGGFIWPVSNCICIVSWNTGPREDLVIELAKALLLDRARCVVIWPRWVDYKTPIVEYDPAKPIGQRYVQIRESIRVYRSKKEAAIAS